MYSSPKIPSGTTLESARKRKFVYEHVWRKRRSIFCSGPIAAGARFTLSTSGPIDEPNSRIGVTCPNCGAAKREIMPTDACLFFCECTICKTLLRPKQGDSLRVLFLWIDGLPTDPGRKRQH